jgi:hypothetical protein
MKYFALIYYVVDDYLARRPAYRAGHLRLAGEAHRRGELLLAGAFTDPVDRALLVFRAADHTLSKSSPGTIPMSSTDWSPGGKSGRGPS